MIKKKFHSIIFVITIFQITMLFLTIFFMFRTKNVNYFLQKEIEFINERMLTDMAMLNVKKTEYAMLSSPDSIAKLTNYYFEDEKKNMYYGKSFKNLEQVAVILNPMGNTVASLSNNAN